MDRYTPEYLVAEPLDGAQVNRLAISSRADVVEHECRAMEIRHRQ